MDIYELYTVDAHDEGAEMQVRDPRGVLIDCYITLAGIDTKRWIEAFNKNTRKKLDGEDNKEASVLAESTIGWRGFANNGEDLVFSKKLAKQLYMNAPYIADQVDKFIANRVNFIKG